MSTNVVWGFPSPTQTVVSTVAPGVLDYVPSESYNRWVYGTDAFAGGSKWQTIADEYDTSDYLKFSLFAATVNGVTQARTFDTITVNHTNLTYRDDGYGLFPVNYVDFINKQLSQYGLNTRIVGSTENVYGNGGDIGFRSNACLQDDFTLIFLEQGQISGGFLPFFYILQSKYGAGLKDTFQYFNNNNPINYKYCIQQLINESLLSCYYWYQPSMPTP